MRPFFARAILASTPAIFASPIRSFGHFRHDSSFGTLALPLILGGKSAITTLFFVVRDDDRSPLFP